MHSTIKQPPAKNQSVKPVWLVCVIIIALGAGLEILPRKASAAPASKAKPSISPEKSGAGGSWTQDRAAGEKAMHMPDAIGSAMLAAKLNTEKDLIASRTLLRKSASELHNLPASGAKSAMQQEIAKLVNDFAFLQATEQAGAKKKPYSEQDADATLQLKSVSEDYAVLVPAVEKHLGPNDPQVISLKQLQDAFRQSFEDHEELLRRIAEKKRQQLERAHK